ncbi:epidermal growth factor receptor kinase substrate 8-like protein 1a [Austrofundulus limnaeus]|uniref:Epidermal growth factor receptor kinase substrate 8-like protein 1a n=1 Tax=Austrofundulus limnaeus TaxID=52670 RepID=A0A2I4CFG0_AUSLI|nr:PREDICTED: epidermal growth factor receptor kinase substrate 8-like protein 1 [Austrofundulus limnaeus]
MSGSHPQVVPRKPAVRVRIASGEQPENVNGASGESSQMSQQNADREVEILNHCFEDVEKFMTRLQQAAEARIVLNQRKKRSGRKDKKTENQVSDLLTAKADPPPEEDFINVFQKIKYSICMLDRLKPFISQPSAPELLHHIFVPLNLTVQTTGGPTLAASVVSPAMTSGAISLLHKHLNKEEKELWISLGTNWTSPCLGLSRSVPLYSPVFLDGWKPRAYDSTGQQLEDPVQSQHKEDAVRDSERRQRQNLLEDPVQSQHKEDAIRDSERMQRQNLPPPTADGMDKIGGNGLLQKTEKLYRCSYAFVARNSSELSVLHGETLEVLDSSKRWWKCRNSYDQTGFVPYNILEPLSAGNSAERNNPELRPDLKQTASNPRTKCHSYTPSSSDGAGSPALTVRPQSTVLPFTSMSREDGDRVLVMNDELLQRLTKQRNSVDQQQVDTPVPLNYHSPPAEVTTWLTANNFSQQTISCLGILTGAQLFSLSEEELCSVISEGPKVYSQLQDQKNHLEMYAKLQKKP